MQMQLGPRLCIILQNLEHDTICMSHYCRFWIDFLEECETPCLLSIATIHEEKYLESSFCDTLQQSCWLNSSMILLTSQPCIFNARRWAKPCRAENQRLHHLCKSVSCDVVYVRPLLGIKKLYDILLHREAGSVIPILSKTAFLLLQALQAEPMLQY